MPPSSPSYASSSFIPLPNLSHLTDQDALDKIDADIARFERHVRALRELRNTIVPISRFPAELLSKIFSQLNEEDVRIGSLGYYSRLKVSWVSRHWRSVALDDPAIWSCIRIYQDLVSDTPSSTVEYTRECLIRSKKSPLSISYHGPICPALALCSSEIRRIENLCIDLLNDNDGWEDILMLLPDEWKQPAPLLVDLKLDGVILEDGLFGGVSCPLQGHVTLKTCSNTWSWSISRLSAITRLFVWGVHELATPEEVASMLEALPALEICTIDMSFDCDPESSNITKPPVCLPNLRRLSIMDDITAVIPDLLQRLDLPNATIELNSPGFPVPETIFDQNFLKFKEYQGLFQNWIRSITFRYSFDGTGAHLFVFSLDSCGQPREFIANGQLEGFNPVVRASQYLDLAEVRNLVLDGVSLEGIKSFGPLPDLELLEIRNMGVDFIRWAMTCWEQFFPSVTKLNVDGISYPGFESFLSVENASKFVHRVLA